MSFIDLREFFTLTELSAEVGRIGDSERTALRRKLAEARQKRDAAELLLYRGSTAEALRLGAESLSCSEQAAGVLIDAGLTAGPPLDRALEDARLFRTDVPALPLLDELVSPAQKTALQRLLRAEYLLDRLVHPYALDSRGLTRMRWTHRARAAGGVAVLVLVFIWFAR